MIIAYNEYDEECDDEECDDEFIDEDEDVDYHDVSEDEDEDYMSEDEDDMSEEADDIDSDDLQRAKSILAELSDAAGVSIKRVSRLLDSVRDVIESLGLEVALAGAEASVRQGNIDSALAIIFDRLDNAFVSGAFCRVDQWLAGMAIDDVSSDVLIGILVASLPAKRELRQRHDFVARVVESLERRGLSEDGLLTGLD